MLMNMNVQDYCPDLSIHTCLINCTKSGLVKLREIQIIHLKEHVFEFPRSDHLSVVGKHIYQTHITTNDKKWQKNRDHVI